MTAPRVDRSLDDLHPAFRVRVERVLADLRVAGHDPAVWETRRSFERADALARRGVGVRRSMHCYGLAVDVVDAVRRWNASPKFWAAYGAACARHGLVWGGNFRKVDRPHAQAVPVALQRRVRAASPAELDRLVRELLPD